MGDWELILEEKRFWNRRIVVGSVVWGTIFDFVDRERCRR